MRLPVEFWWQFNGSRLGRASGRVVKRQKVCGWKITAAHRAIWAVGFRGVFPLTENIVLYLRTIIFERTLDTEVFYLVLDNKDVPR